MTHLIEGEKAPSFKVLDEIDESINLQDYKGKKLILFFYPKAMTPGCTNEAKNLEEFYSELKAKGFEVLGVSPDAAEKQVRFKEKYNLSYPLIPDTEKKLIMDYGIWGPKKLYGREYEGLHRTTFIIDEDSKILKIIKKVKTKEHAQQILKLLAE